MKLGENNHLMRKLFSQSFMRIGKKMWIFHTVQDRPIMELECAAFWAIWGDSGYYVDPQIIEKSRFERGNLEKLIDFEFWIKKPAAIPKRYEMHCSDLYFFKFH